MTWSSLRRHLKEPLHDDPLAFCQVILGGKCAQAGIERDRSGLVENTVPFDIRKFRKFKTDFLVEWNAPDASSYSPLSSLSTWSVRSWCIKGTGFFDDRWPRSPSRIALLVLVIRLQFDRGPSGRQGYEKLIYRLIRSFSSTEIFSKRRKIYAWWRKTRVNKKEWRRYIYLPCSFFHVVCIWYSLLMRRRSIQRI